MGLTGEEKKKYQRDYMAKKRSNKGLTNGGSNKVKVDGSNSQGLTMAGVPVDVTMLARPNGPDYDPAETLPDGSLRYMGPFSDGQVLDRLMCKEVKNVKPAPIRRTTIDNGVPSIVNAMVDTNKREVLIDICNQLKLHSTLVMVDGKFKHENCLGMVNYGIGGPDMGVVAEMIEVTG